MTNTEAGPSSGVQITRTAGGTALAWVTDPLNGVDLTAAAWTFHIWGKESAAGANAALRFQVWRWTNAEASEASLDDNSGTELTTTNADYMRTSGNASVTTMNDGDRLVFKILIDDAGTMAASQTVTVSYNGQYARAEGDTYFTCPDTLAVTATMPAATRTHVRQHLRDTGSTNPMLTNDEVDQAFTAALRTFSSDRPRIAIQSYSGDGSTYEFSLPSEYVWGFSRIFDIEYPTGDQVRTLIDREDWEVVEERLGLQPLRQLRFVTTTPDSGTDNFAVWYTTRHTHDDEFSTLSDEEFEAVTYLAAANGAEILSARGAASIDSTLAVDSSNFRDAQLRWKQVAEQFRALYEEIVGVTVGVTSIRDWDTNLQIRGIDRVFHSKIWR